MSNDVVNRINFSYNWNNKLNCNAYTTLRLRNDAKYKIGQLHEITLEGSHKHYARILDIKHTTMHSLNEYIARLDTGYSLAECKDVLRKMYPKADWNHQPISIILLAKEQAEKQGNLF